MATLLLIEDETILRTAVADFLVEQGHTMLTAADGDAGLQLAMTRKPDLVVLDVMLPGQDGFAVCQALRRQRLTMPVIMLTARGLVRDRIAGLDAGADDYMTKPFNLHELAARIRAMLRRSDTPGQPVADEIAFGPVLVNLATREVRRAGSLVSLNAKEYGLLKMLLEASGRPVSREDLLEVVWGYHAYVATRTVDNHMARLRAKLEPDPENPRYLLTVPKLGYRLVLE